MDKYPKITYKIIYFLFLTFLALLASYVRADIVVGGQAVLGNQNLNCQNYTVLSGAASSLNGGILQNVTKLEFNSNSNLIVNNPNFTFDISHWRNNGLILTGSIPQFTFNSCGSIVIEGSGDLDGDGVPDGQENCLIPNASTQNGPYAFTDPNVIGCRSTNTNLTPIPSLEIYSLLLLLSLILVTIKVYKNKQRTNHNGD